MSRMPRTEHFTGVFIPRASSMSPDSETRRDSSGAFRRPCVSPRGRSRRGGFTILEILIASAILVVGLVGVLALFPAGISSGRKVVEDSTAVAIARSVADAIRSGMRNNLRYRTSGSGGVFTYFVFQHDGVKDSVPRIQSKESSKHDYFILLPRFRENRSFVKGMRGRLEAKSKAKTFVYPESDPDVSGVSANGGPKGNPYKADNDGDDYQQTALVGGVEEVFKDVLVRKVYHLGSQFPGVSDEGPDVLDDQKREVLKQYSFAFSIQNSLYDANMVDTTDQFRPGNELYHFRIMIFRSFDKNFREDDPEAEPVKPVFEMFFEAVR